MSIEERKMSGKRVIELKDGSGKREVQKEQQGGRVHSPLTTGGGMKGTLNQACPWAIISILLSLWVGESADIVSMFKKRLKESRRTLRPCRQILKWLTIMHQEAEN